MAADSPKRRNPTTPAQRPQRRGRPTKLLELHEKTIEAMPRRNPADIVARAEAFQRCTPVFANIRRLVKLMDGALGPAPSAYETPKLRPQRLKATWQTFGSRIAAVCEHLSREELGQFFDGLAQAVRVEPAERDQRENKSCFRRSVVERAYANVWDRLLKEGKRNCCPTHEEVRDEIQNAIRRQTETNGPDYAPSRELEAIFAHNNLSRYSGNLKYQKPSERGMAVSHRCKKL